MNGNDYSSEELEVTVEVEILVDNYIYPKICDKTFDLDSDSIENDVELAIVEVIKDNEEWMDTFSENKEIIIPEIIRRFEIEQSDDNEVSGQENGTFDMVPDREKDEQKYIDFSEDVKKKVEKVIKIYADTTILNIQNLQMEFEGLAEAVGDLSDDHDDLKSVVNKIRIKSLRYYAFKPFAFLWKKYKKKEVDKTEKKIKVLNHKFKKLSESVKIQNQILEILMNNLGINLPEPESDVVQPKQPQQVRPIKTKPKKKKRKVPKSVPKDDLDILTNSDDDVPILVPDE